MRYRLSPLAEQDLRDLWAYVAEESGEERSDTVLDAIVERIEMLAAYPRAGRRRPEFGAGVRSIAVESHVIYYREEDGILSIARVLHGRRDQLAAWDEERGPDDQES